jgi:hypothetical protein
VAEQEFFVEQLDADETFLNEKFEEMLVCIMNSITIMYVVLVPQKKKKKK